MVRGKSPGDSAKMIPGATHAASASAACHTLTPKNAAVVRGKSFGDSPEHAGYIHTHASAACSFAALPAAACSPAAASCSAPSFFASSFCACSATVSAVVVAPLVSQYSITFRFFLTIFFRSFMALRQPLLRQLPDAVHSGTIPTFSKKLDFRMYPTLFATNSALIYIS